MTATRRLAAIVAIDVIGYSRLMGEDEAGTALIIREHREAARPIIAGFSGRIVKTMGDGLLLEFTSVVAAVECAIAIQTLMIKRNVDVPKSKRIVYRVGVNLGDVLIEGDDILGDGVNIAARLEGICEPGGVLISGAAHDHVRGKIDADFADLGDQALKNIALPVKAYAVKIGEANVPSVASSQTPDRPGPPRLSIVVLPFANIGGEVEQDYFVDGVTESLTTDLSRIGGSFVIGRNTAFTYKGKPANLRQIGRELNVRYVLEGSVQRSGNRMRVNVQLIDAETGHHLWAERFDKPLVDLFDLQDEIVARLASTLKTELVAAEARRAQQRPSLDSVDLYFQGMAVFNRGVSPDNVAEARSFFDRALVADPNNFDALVELSGIDVTAASLNYVPNPQANFRAAELNLGRAFSGVRDHARGHMWLGITYALTKRPAQGVAQCEHAVSLDRNLAYAHTWIGFAKIYDGRAKETEAHVVEALRLSPRDTTAHISAHIAGLSKVFLGEWEQAVVWCQRAIDANRAYPFPHLLMGAALARLGRKNDAYAAAKAGIALLPTYSVSRAHALWLTITDNPICLTQIERLIDSLRLAGVPE